MRDSRRDFLKKISITALALSGGIDTCIIAREKDVKWDEFWDVVVVGSGFAGSAAICEAIDMDAKTLMIEKMPVLGGNSAINGGAFAIVGSPHQKKKGIIDSYDLYIKDILKAGLNLNQKDLVEVIAKNGYEAYKFTVDRGVVYRDDLGHFGGHSVPRTIWPEINSGGKITIPLQEYAQNKGALIRTRVIFDDLIFDSRGRLLGIRVRENYNFHYDPRIDESENKSGIVKHYRIYGGVIMASGGFSYDIKFRQQIDLTVTPDLDCTNHYGATAYTLKALMRHNVQTVDLKWIQLGPWGSPDEKGFGIAPVFAIPAFAYGIMVDARTGKRFVNELADRKYVQMRF